MKQIDDDNDYWISQLSVHKVLTHPEGQSARALFGEKETRSVQNYFK